MRSDTPKLLVKGGQIYDHDGDVHKPAMADILIEGDRIVAVGTDFTNEQVAGAERHAPPPLYRLWLARLPSRGRHLTRRQLALPAQ